VVALTANANASRSPRPARPDGADDVVQFFRDRLSKVAGGGPHMLAMGIDRMDACLARRRAAQPSIQAFLAGH
jgi:hypothetical protein